MTLSGNSAGGSRINRAVFSRRFFPVMHQPPKDDNSNELLYSLSSAFDIPPTSTEIVSRFTRPSPLPSHSRSDSMPSFVRRAHPSLDLYKTNHNLRQSEKSTQSCITPTSPHGTQRLPIISTSRSRSSSYAYSDGDDEALPENATEQDKIDWRRRRNTLAARKSRKRKQDQMQQLQDDVQRLSKEKDVWRERALMMKQLLMSHGLPSPNFDR